MEKWPSMNRGSELQLVQEELFKTQAELAFVESVKLQAFQELGHMKKLLDESTIKLKEADEQAKKERVKAIEMERASFTASEDWQADLAAMNRQYQAEIGDLQHVRLFYEDLKLEFIAATNAKEEAVRQAGEAMTAAETASKHAELLFIELAEAKASLVETSSAIRRAGELADELSVTKAALAEACAVYQNAAEEVATTLAEKEFQLQKAVEVSLQVKNEAEQCKRELLASKQFESKLCEMNIVVENLKVQLLSTKEAEQQHAEAALVMSSKLETVTSELHQARIAESMAVSSLDLVRTELEETQASRNRISEEVVNVTASVHSLTKENKSYMMQILELQEKESNALAESAASTAKFIEATNNLEKARAKERSTEDKLGCMTALLEEAGIEVQLLRQQVSKAKSEVQKESMEAMAAKDQVLWLRKALEATQAYAQKAHTDNQAATDEHELVTEMAVMVLSLEENKSQTLKSMPALLLEAGTDYQQAMEVRSRNDEAKAAYAKGNLVFNLTNASLSSQKDEQQMDSDIQMPRDELKMANRTKTVASRAEANAINEALQTGQEAELAQNVYCTKRSESSAQIEQSTHAGERAEAAVAEIANSKTENCTVHVDSDCAMAAMDLVQSRLEDAPREIETVKCTRSNAPYKFRETQDRSREFSESWEIVESGSDGGNSITQDESRSEVGINTKQDEYATLKRKLQEAEEVKAFIKSEFDSIKGVNEKLSIMLDAAKLEIEAIKKSEQEACQRSERVENEKMILEAEVQRLTSKEEQLLKGWGAVPDGLDLNTECSFSPLMSEERKFQQVSLGQVMLRDLSLLRKDEDDGEESVEVTPRLTKKKKALLLRIGTYLTKKKVR